MTCGASSHGEDAAGRSGEGRRRPLDPDEYEIMIVARKAGDPVAGFSVGRGG
jgi:hypothetical protein